MNRIPSTSTLTLTLTVGTLVAAAGALLSGPAGAAQDVSGPYVGADLGRGMLSDAAGSIDGALSGQGIAASSSLKRHATSYKVDLGYQFNPYFAVEGNYVDLGRYHVASAAAAPAADTLDGHYKADGLALVGVGIVPLDNGFSLYGKAGAIRSTARLQLASQTGTVGVADVDSSRTGLTYGVGAGYDITKNVTARLELDRYNRIGNDTGTGTADVNVVTIGAAYRF
jgi:OOP family OmpA-OmpF porin